MFVHSWPLWANIAILAAILIVKWLAVKWIENSPAVAKILSTKGWMAKANISAGLNAIATFVILFLLTGVSWAIFLAVVDGIVHWLIAYWQRKHALPTISDGNVATAKNWWAEIKSWFSSISVGTYISIASTVAGYAVNHGSAVTSFISSLLSGLGKA